MTHVMNHFFFVDVLKENGTAEQRDFFYAELLAGRRFGNALPEKGTRHALEFAARLEPRPDGSYTLTGTEDYSTGALFAPASRSSRSTRTTASPPPSSSSAVDVPAA
ncbi:hypothetical protein [Streptomyces chartreusis]